MSAQYPIPRRGFSLVELVYVTAIIAIVCAIVLPHWSGSVQNYQLSLAARRISADLAWAQSLANSTSTSVTVTFSTDTGKYQLANVNDPDRAGQSYTIDLTADPYRVKLVSVFFGGAGSAPTTFITFNGFGAPSRGGTIVISSGGAQKTITVDSSTGQATVQ